MPSAPSNSHVSSTSDIPTTITTTATPTTTTTVVTTTTMPAPAQGEGNAAAAGAAEERSSIVVIGSRVDDAVRREAVRERAFKSVADDDDDLGLESDPPVAVAAAAPSKHSMDYVIRSGVAGGLAGCAAKTTVAPLDRVKILFQTSNPQFAKYSSTWTGFGRAILDIHAHAGVPGLFRGHSATLLKIYPYAAIKFVAYEQYRAVLIGAQRQRETWRRRFAAGALAGVTSVFFTYPLDIVRVRLAFETKHARTSLAEICRKIYREHPLPQPASSSSLSAPAAVAATAAATSPPRTAAAAAVLHPPRYGLMNFYRGFSTTLLGMVPYAGVSFLTHDTAGDILRHPSIRRWTTQQYSDSHPQADRDSSSNKPRPLRAWAELASGGVAGAISQTVSYPLEVMRRRMQVGGAVGDGRRLRIAETARLVFRERGVPGFFVGLTIGYVKVVPMAAVSFYTYERAKMFLGI